MMRKILAATLPALVLVLPLMACSEGPGESAGRSLDRAGENIRDTIDPPKGPGERLGRSVDRAF
ncbi:hypothetical protein [Teichococcus aestuarii]|uniref:Argininosuccinate lyase n=2 Tax=Teichococcus aestuarii TaxID=568898 RepID=A0A2U1V7Z2_9PROT|nr:hypothetical protein [Pseudoroseomonas aestuarii]PWC30011.1 hypothetical protein CR165_03860 [Pseudoroseomonas aestuarii]